MDSGCNLMSTFCSRLIFLLEDFLRSTNDTRSFLAETCEDLVRLNKCFSTTKSDYTCEVDDRTLANVDKYNVNVKQEIQRKKYNEPSGNSKYQINNQHTDPRNKIKKMVKKKSSSLITNYSSNLAQNQKILSGVIYRPTCQKRRIMPSNIHMVNGTVCDISCITDAKTNLKCVNASISKNNTVHCSDRCFPCNGKFFKLLEDMKHSEPPLHMLNLFKNHNSYLINTFATTVYSSIVKNGMAVKSDSNIVENCSPEKRFLNTLSFVNSSGLNEATDPVVKLLYETQSIYLAVMEVRSSEESKLDYLLWERITCLERRFLHLLNFCESASFNVKDDKKQIDVSYKNKIIWKGVEFWNQACANEVQALIEKPYVKYKNMSQWGNYQKTLQIIQQKKMQLQILEIISDFLPQLQNLDPNSPNTYLLLTMVFTLASIDKHSIPLLVKV